MAGSGLWAQANDRTASVYAGSCAVWTRLIMVIVLPVGLKATSSMNVRISRSPRPPMVVRSLGLNRLVEPGCVKARPIIADDERGTLAVKSHHDVNLA